MRSDVAQSIGVAPGRALCRTSTTRKESTIDDSSAFADSDRDGTDDRCGSGLGPGGLRPAPLRAASGDRSGESVVATGPVFVRYDESAKAAIPLDAVYFLDYKGGRLLATVPTFRQSTSSTQLIEAFAERDLVADFKLDLESGAAPRFLMTTGSLGPYTSGWAPFYVFETTTSQVGGVPDPDARVDGQGVAAPVRAARAAFLRQDQRRETKPSP